MASKKVARKLDRLVLAVHQVELLNCQDDDEFRRGLVHMKRNLRALLTTFASIQPTDPRALRALEQVTFRASRLLRLCRSVPKKYEHPEQWRAAATSIVATYEMLRVEAGHLYELLVPCSPFGVLRSAL